MKTLGTKVQYVLRTSAGKWVERDDSTGPMSTGGYPHEVDTLDRATFWDDLEGAVRYQQMFIRSTPFEIRKVTSTMKIEKI